MVPETISLLVRSQVPVLVIAPPGTGRTSFGMSFVNPSVPYLIPDPDLCIMLSVPTLDPVEIGGATYASNNRPVTVAREAFHRAYKRRMEIARETKKMPPVLFFLDEITNASYDQLSAIQSAISSGIWGGKQFDPPVWIFAAGNPPELSMLAQELPMPIRTRFLVLPWSLNTNYEAYFVEKYYRSFEKHILKTLDERGIIDKADQDKARAILRERIKSMGQFSNHALGDNSIYEWQHPELPTPNAMRYARLWAYGQVRLFVSSYGALVESARKEKVLDTIEGYPTSRTFEIVAEALAVLRATQMDSPQNIREVCIGGLGKKVGSALAESAGKNIYPPPNVIFSWLEKGYIDHDLSNKDETYIYGLGEYAMTVYREKLKELSTVTNVMDLNEQQIKLLDNALTVLTPLLKSAPALRTRLIDMLGNYTAILKFNVNLLNFAGEYIENAAGKDPAEVFNEILSQHMRDYRIKSNLPVMQLVIKHASLFALTEKAQTHLKALADETTAFAQKLAQLRKEVREVLKKNPLSQ